MREERKHQLRHYAFYLHEQRKWERKVGSRLVICLPLILLTLLSAYNKKPIETICGITASSIGLKSLNKANFYRRRATYKVRQEAKTLEG